MTMATDQQQATAAAAAANDVVDGQAEKLIPNTPTMPVMHQSS